MNDHMPHCPGGKRCQEWPICGHGDQDHEPLSVWSVDDIPFVKCSCSTTKHPTTHVWIRDHFSGTPEEGSQRLSQVVAAQREAAEQTDETGGA